MSSTTESKPCGDSTETVTLLTPRAQEAPAPLLTPEQQEFFLDLRSRGASPTVACQQLGTPLASFLRTMDDDPDFKAAVDQVNAALSQNVVAALYQTAMKGNVTAQKLWLATSPPPGWRDEIAGQNDSDPLDALSDEELVELSRAMGIEIPPEIEAKAQRRNT